MSRRLSLLLVVLCLAGLAGMAFAVPGALDDRLLDDQGTVVDGVVESVAESTEGKPPHPFWVRYHFAPASGTTTRGLVLLDHGEAAGLAPGSTVRVRYLPERPALNRLDVHAPFGEKLLLSLGGLVLFVGAGSLWFRWRGRPQPEPG